MVYIKIKDMYCCFQFSSNRLSNYAPANSYILQVIILSFFVRYRCYLNHVPSNMINTVAIKL